MSAQLASSTSAFWISCWLLLDDVDGSSEVGGGPSESAGSFSSSLSAFFPLVDFLTVVKENELSEQTNKRETNDKISYFKAPSLGNSFYF